MEQLISLFITFIISFIAFFGIEEQPVRPSNPPMREITIIGTVIGTIDDCAFDGICALIIQGETQTYNAIWAQGMIPCEGQMDNPIPMSATVEVFGLQQDIENISICPSADYYIKIKTDTP